ncbi:MAG: TIGR03936 family radical SAM-associated protein [Oscillospiraceae bacterium]|nr:TIGR03936 family radical SAM-associated protein [Oscillospiraceae bacterium]
MMNVRVFYTKTGRARFISHLDMMRFMTRALKRSGLPVWYTEGFNRHIYTTFALPLSLGFESQCEFMDFRLLPDEFDMQEVADRLNACLTPDIQIKAAAPVGMDPKVITWADFRITFWAQQESDALQQAFRNFCAQSEIVVEKKTKRSLSTVDIAPLMELLDTAFSDENATADLRLAAGNTMNINPNLVLQAFWQHSGLEPVPVQVMRLRVLDKDFQDFA